MFEYFFAFFPMLSGYSFNGISLDIVVMAIMAVFILRYQGIKIVIDEKNRTFVVLFSYAIFKDILIALLGQSNNSVSFHRLLLNFTYMFLFLILLRKDFDQDKFYKGLKISGTFFTAGLIYHIVLIYILNLPAKGISIIPGFEFENNNWLNRPRSFFSEPAALAQAMLPLLFYSLHRKNYKWSLLATFTIFMSTSTTGIVLSGILWFMEFVIGDGKKLHKVLIVFLFVVCGIILVNSEIASNSVSALQDRLAGGGSTSVRVFLGFEILGKMTPSQYISGLLYNKAYDFAVQNISLFPPSSIVRITVGYGEGAFFVNAIVSLIFRYGIIGFILYFLPYKRKIFNKLYIGRSLAIMTIVEMIGDSMLFNSYYFFIMPVLFYLGQEREDIFEDTTYRVWTGESDVGLL